LTVVDEIAAGAFGNVYHGAAATTGLSAHRRHVRFLPCGERDRHREAMARFGEGLKAIEAVARDLA
jgi:hypothetical protein